MSNNISFQNQSHTISNLAMVVIFIYFLMVMRCWLGFGGRTQMMTYAFPLLMLVLITIGQMKVEFKRQYVVYVLIVFIFRLLGLKTGSNINAVIFQMFVPINILFALSIPDNEKEYVLSAFIKWFGWIMLLGIPFYLVCILGNIPNIVTIMSDYGNTDISAGLFSNYLVFIKPLERESLYSIMRFNGPFIEPGDLGCTAAFMLMAAKFDFKRYDNLVWVFIGLLFSMSLGGYMLALIGYFFVSFAQGKISKYRLFIIFFLLLGVYLFGTYYNFGDNFVNETILSRLRSDEETGFAGNNRNSLLKTEYFFAMFDDYHTMLFGYDEQIVDFLNEEGLGAGFVDKAINVGMIGMIGLILPYFYIAKTSSSKMYAWFFFVFFLFYLFQRSESTWICYVICYVYGIVISERDKSELEYMKQ